VPFKVENVSLAANGSLLAVTGGNGITVLSSATLQQIHRLDGPFISSHFGTDGTMWTCVRLDYETVRLEIFEPQSWTKVAETEVADRFTESTFLLLPHPEKNCAVVFAGAGQDGQCFSWARKGDNTIEVEPFPELDFTTPPSFSPTGEEFLVISEPELRLYKYPQGPLVAKMEWAHGDEEGSFDFFVEYAGAKRALTQSMDDRLFLVDLEAMTIEDEVRFFGHEPTMVTGADYSEMAYDLKYFVSLGSDRFLYVHNREPGFKDGRHDQLLTWRIPG
jgi:hypothetical protein